MARTGRPPKPLEQKRRAGNPGKRPLPNGSALAVVPHVEPSPLEQPLLHVFDQVLAQGAPWLAATDIRLVHLRELLEEREQVRDAVMGGDSGRRKELREIDKQVSESLSLLGFDPAARARLGLAEAKAVSKLEQIRDRQAKRRTP